MRPLLRIRSPGLRSGSVRRPPRWRCKCRNCRRPDHGEACSEIAHDGHEALFERLIERGCAEVPVRVPDEDVDAIGVCQLKILLPCRGFSLVQFAEHGLAGLVMTLEPGSASSH